MVTLSSLLTACDALDKQPTPLPEAHAQAFTADFPLATIFQLLSAHDCDPAQVDTICSALDKLLATQHGTSLLPSARPYAQAALSSPHQRLRRLGVTQLGRLLLLLTEGTGGGQQQQQQGQQQQQQEDVEGLEVALLEALKDDTGVAAASEAALLSYVAAHPAAFAALLSGSSPAGGVLSELCSSSSSSSTQRMRAFSLLVNAAGGNRGLAEQLKGSGVVQQLLQQLDPRDPLSCLVALQLLQELVPHMGGATASLMQELLLPALLPLLDDPSTAPGAFPIAAQLVAAAVTASYTGSTGSSGSNGVAAMQVDTAAAAANGNGVLGHDDAADVLLSKMAAVLDDRGCAGVEEELVVLDAAHCLALPSPTSAALLAAPAAGSTLAGICSRALGRTAGPEVRLAALHALASIAGLERAGEAKERSAALLVPAAEDALREGVFGAVSGTAGGAGGARTPAEAVWQLLQQPFDETRTGVYRCCSSLALRPWFAADVCSNSSLLSRLCTTDSESGQQACEWRHSTVMALWATLQHLIALPDDAPDAQYKQRLPAAVQQQLAAAVRGGPYGAGGAGRGTQQSHFVATVP